VLDAFAVARLIGEGGICLSCAGYIDGTQLQLEAFSPEQRAAAKYVEDVPAPSVITMNAMSTALALNDFLFMFTRLHSTEDLGPRRYHFLEREPVAEALPAAKGCPHCAGRKARGDTARLPVRQA
jgi:hypothetical protein